MPDKKISELPEIPTPVTTGDILIAVRSGVNYKVPANKLPKGSEQLEYNDDFDI